MSFCKNIYVHENRVLPNSALQGYLVIYGIWTQRRQWHSTPVLLQATSLSLFTFHELEKEMATHSSVLAWRIPGTGEPGGLPSKGSHRVGHDWSDSAAAAAAVYGLYYLSEFRNPSECVGKASGTCLGSCMYFKCRKHVYSTKFSFFFLEGVLN